MTMERDMAQEVQTDSSTTRESRKTHTSKKASFGGFTIQSTSINEALNHWRLLHGVSIYQLVKIASLGEGDRKNAKLTAEWSKVRRFLHVAILSNIFNAFMAVVIVFNMVLVMMEVDRQAMCDQGITPCTADDPDIVIPSQICTIIYVVEVLLKLFVYRQSFFQSPWHITDTIIVVTSVLGEFFDSVFQDAALFRLVRVLKIVRALRLLTMFQELYLMIASMASTMRTIFWACVLLAVVMSVLALIAMEILNPVQREIWQQRFDSGKEYDCHRCPHAFESVGACMVTLSAGLIMGDGIADIFVPLIEHDFWSALFILSSVALVFLGFSNLILSVIVDKGNEARCQDTTYQAMAQRKMKRKAARELVSLWQELELESGETLSVQQLEEQCKTNEVVQNYFKNLDMDMEFLHYALSIIDSDPHGHVSLQRFADAVVQMKSTDVSPIVSFLRYQVAQVINDLSTVKQQVSSIRDEVQRPQQPWVQKVQVPTDVNSEVVKRSVGVSHAPGTARAAEDVELLRPAEDVERERSAEELLELLKCAYERPLPLNMPHLRGLGRHFADTCQKVEVQIGRLLSRVQEEPDENAVRLELFACSSRLVAAVSKALPKMLPTTPCGKNNKSTSVSRNGTDLSNWSCSLRSPHVKQSEPLPLHSVPLHSADQHDADFGNEGIGKTSPRRSTLGTITDMAKLSGVLSRTSTPSSSRFAVTTAAQRAAQERTFNLGPAGRVEV
mmetsp:Transcript_61951/g.122532  ORF Transcript_61951/g.122532 Transcript_61951/m.122532 type:complete len:728 (+) Transcript_61951:80-2263(+)